MENNLTNVKNFYETFFSDKEVIEIAKKFVKLISEEEVVFEGWVRRTRQWKETIDGTESSPSEWRYGHTTNRYNPYVYNKGKAGKAKITRTPIYSDEGRPDSKAYITVKLPRDWRDPLYRELYRQREIQASEYRKVFTAWWDARPIVGYVVSETQIVPAKIVIDK